MCDITSQVLNRLDSVEIPLTLCIGTTLRSYRLLSLVSLRIIFVHRPCINWELKVAFNWHISGSFLLHCYFFWLLNLLIIVFLIPSLDFHSSFIILWLLSKLYSLCHPLCRSVYEDIIDHKGHVWTLSIFNKWQWMLIIIS